MRQRQLSVHFADVAVREFYGVGRGESLDEIAQQKPQKLLLI